MKTECWIMKPTDASTYTCTAGVQGAFLMCTPVVTTEQYLVCQWSQENITNVNFSNSRFISQLVNFISFK